MKVCIDDLLTVDCEGFLNGGERWNGFEQPLFNAEQLATIQKWWIENDNGVHNGDTWRDQYTDIGDGFFLVEGWVWEIARGE